MSLIEQWANNLGATEPINGSWINAIANEYGATNTNNNTLLDIAIQLGASNVNGNLYQSIAIKLTNKVDMTPINGSYLARIVETTIP